MLYRVADGILLSFSAMPDGKSGGGLPTGSPHALLKSLDNGHNWFCQTVVRGWLYNEAFPYAQLADGRLLGMLGGACGVFLDEDGIPYSLVFTSEDGARTWDDPRKATVLFPPPIVLGEPVVGMGSTRAPIAFEGKCITRHDGMLLRIADGTFAGDAHTRVGVMQSADEGRSWTWLSTVADTTTAPVDFNESALLEVAENEMLCVMRTDGDPRGNILYQARSHDGGRTWDPPVSLERRGVRPQMVTLRNGVIACSYGRLNGSPSTGVQVMFSRDAGATWEGHTTVYEYASTGYTALLEIRPNVLLLVYDVLGYGWSHANSINSVTISIAMETSTR